MDHACGCDRVVCQGLCGVVCGGECQYLRVWEVYPPDDTINGYITRKAGRHPLCFIPRAVGGLQRRIGESDDVDEQQLRHGRQCIGDASGVWAHPIL